MSEAVGFQRPIDAGLGVLDYRLACIGTSNHQDVIWLMLEALNDCVGGMRKLMIIDPVLLSHTFHSARHLPRCHATQLLYQLEGTWPRCPGCSYSEHTSSAAVADHSTSKHTR